MRWPQRRSICARIASNWGKKNATQFHAVFLLLFDLLNRSKRGRYHGVLTATIDATSNTAGAHRSSRWDPPRPGDRRQEGQRGWAARHPADCFLQRSARNRGKIECPRYSCARTEDRRAPPGRAASRRQVSPARGRMRDPARASATAGRFHELPQRRSDRSCSSIPDGGELRRPDSGQYPRPQKNGRDKQGRSDRRKWI